MKQCSILDLVFLVSLRQECVGIIQYVCAEGVVGWGRSDHFPMNDSDFLEGIQFYNW